MTARRDADAVDVRGVEPSPVDDEAVLLAAHQEVAALLTAWVDRGISPARGAAILLGFAARQMAEAGVTCAEFAAANQSLWASVGKDASLLLPEEAPFLGGDADEIHSDKPLSWRGVFDRIRRRLRGDLGAYGRPGGAG